RYFGATYKAYRSYLVKNVEMLGDAHRFLGALVARKCVFRSVLAFAGNPDGIVMRKPPSPARTFMRPDPAYGGGPPMDRANPSRSMPVAIPAADSRRKVLAHLSGNRIVDMVREDLKLSDVLNRQAFENAITVNAAIGGSTNFIIHLLAIAARIGVDLTMDDFNTAAKGVPLLANLQPSGKYFMEDFYYAGGLPVLMKELKQFLHNDTITVSGKPVSANYDNCECYNSDVISSIDKPFNTVAGIAVVKGNLAVNGAVLKPSAATPSLLVHTGKAVVFETIEDYRHKIDDPDLDVEEGSILVLKNVGPKGYPGMPEVGNMSIPKKLLDKGVRDMVRISDGRMSGTGFGTVVLHVSPEAAVGGTLAIVQDGDIIRLDVPAGILHIELTDKEIAERKSKLLPQPNISTRGYAHLYQMHVEQAHLGADLDFLRGCSGSEVVRDSH
ncbi:MAG: hypothetical protein EOP51_18025, partial [Sphingobacteriales bacterium]